MTFVHHAVLQLPLRSAPIHFEPRVARAMQLTPASSQTSLPKRVCGPTTGMRLLKSLVWLAMGDRLQLLRRGRLL
jgi:hypothetical protein